MKIMHVNSSKVHPLKQLCLQEDELCFTLLLIFPKMEHFEKVRSKVVSKDELCLNLSINAKAHKLLFKVRLV